MRHLNGLAIIQKLQKNLGGNLKEIYLITLKKRKKNVLKKWFKMVRCLCNKEIKVNEIINEFIALENSYADRESIQNINLLEKMKEKIKTISED